MMAREGFERDAVALGIGPLLYRFPHQLSIGQLQRFALVLAMNQGASTLLLDEPTSALDAENEAAVAESLKLLCQGRTAIIASHRPEVLKFARRVIVLDAGRIVADGTPEQVRRENEFFRRMSGEK